MKNLYQSLLTAFLFVSLFFIADNTFAVTAKPGYTQFTQPDGTTLTIGVKGDEFVHWAVTIDGYTLLANKYGAYEYAMLNDKGNLILSGIQANEPGNRSFKEASFLKNISAGLFFTAAQIAELKEMCPIKPDYGKKIGGFPTTGTNKLLVILANFNNTTTTYTQTQFNNFMNQSGYSPYGSFKDFYLENSYNLLTLNSTVTVWVTVPNTHNYYGPEAKWAEFVRDAVNAADAAGVDFSQYDNDSDGDVDGVAVFHQGRGQEESGSTNDIWSHSWTLTSGGFPGVYKDGKLINDYTCQPEKGGASSMVTIGVMCHEFGHNLGAPDFYDTDYGTGGSYIGTGTWDVMADGSWNGGGARPCHHNAWTKAYYTWTTPTLITTTGTKTLHKADSYAESFKFITATTNEYYLMENRQKVGFDAGIPGHGMIIYHVDGNYIISHMSGVNAGSHQGMYPVCASATGNPPTTYGSINSGGCPYPGTSSKTSFTDATTPWAKSWAGVNSNTPINTITEASQVITFNVSSVGGTAPVVDFMTGGSTNILQGGSVDFYDNSSNNPTGWSWTFNGGTPGNSSVQYPSGIVYNTVGSFDVTLVASNPYGSNSLTKTGYINVAPVNVSDFSMDKFIKIYPNPSSGTITLNLYSPNMEKINVTIINILGISVYSSSISKTTDNYTSNLDLSYLTSGLYYITISNNKEIVTKRILIQK